MTTRYWLARTHSAMIVAGDGRCWLPGSTAWREYMPALRDPERAIRHAQRLGWLTQYTGIPALTREGCQKAL
jgi:hypothetical protein